MYLKRIKFNTSFILERSNLVVLVLVPLEILKISFPVSQMIWMQNLIEMKNYAIVMVLEVLNMSQTFSLDLNSLLKYFFQTGLILNTVPILVPEQSTKISTVLRLIRLRYSFV